MNTPSQRPQSRPRILRQPLGNRIAHWVIALSTLALIFSGFGQMPMYERYGLSSLPLMGWTADYSVTLLIHYIAAMALIFGIVFHLVFALTRKRLSLVPRRGDVRESIRIIAAMLGRGEEPPSDKYLAEQRLAYAFIGVNLVVVTLSGAVKVVKNLPGVDVPFIAVFVATTAHNVATVFIVLGVVAHLFAFAFKANRNLLPAMFSGRVDAEYVAHRHSKWAEAREWLASPVPAPQTDSTRAERVDEERVA